MANSSTSLAHAKNRAAAVLDLLVTLPPERRDLVLLCDFEGQSGVEAASRLGRTPAWVRITLHRTRQELRAAFSKLDN